ncbi:MAG: hypothetical protein KDA66_11160, partial [Planctomycetaceae bacterium]|nr:hypothetical protein [Planctomycetaceae bacterium]
GENGVFVIHTGTGDDPGYLSAQRPREGSKVDFKGENKTKWELREDGDNWSLHLGANCLTMGQSGLRLYETGDSLVIGQSWRLDRVN